MLKRSVVLWALFSAGMAVACGLNAQTTFMLFLGALVTCGFLISLDCLPSLLYSVVLVLACVSTPLVSRQQKSVTRKIAEWETVQSELELRLTPPVQLVTLPPPGESPVAAVIPSAGLQLRPSQVLPDTWASHHRPSPTDHSDGLPQQRPPTAAPSSASTTQALAPDELEEADESVRAADYADLMDRTPDLDFLDRIKPRGVTKTNNTRTSRTTTTTTTQIIETSSTSHMRDTGSGNRKQPVPRSKTWTLNLADVPQLRWSKNLMKRIFDSLEYEVEVPGPPPALWDRDARDAKVNGVFRYIDKACNGSPDVRQIATSADPEHDLLVLAEGLPDQQRRHRIAVVVHLLRESPLLRGETHSSKGTGQLEDDWAASTLLGALIGVSQDEFSKLVHMIRRSKLVSKLSESELALQIQLAQKIAEFAVSQPVRRNTTYDFIVSGKPLSEAPTHLVTMLNLLKSTTKNSSGPPPARTSTARREEADSGSERLLLPLAMNNVLDDITQIIDESVLPHGDEYRELLRLQNRVLKATLACLIGWMVLSGLYIAKVCCRKWLRVPPA